MILLSIETALADQITLNVSLDTYVYEGSPSNRYGSLDRITAGKGANGYVYLSYLYFSTSPLPSPTNITLNSARLWVKATDTATQDCYISVYRSAGAWNESITFNTAPAYVNKYDMNAPQIPNHWYSFDVTAFLNYVWIQGNINNGLVLAPDNTNKNGELASFYSREYSSSSDAYIVVDYTQNTCDLFEISPSSQSFSCQAGTGSVNITTRSNCCWTATSNASWLTVTSGSSGCSDGVVAYSVAKNTGSQRTGTITMYCSSCITSTRTFTVTQSGTGCPSVNCDFNNDGKTDILWRNKSTGQNVVWFMNGTTYSSYVELLQVPETNWQIVGTGDFNGDGKADILWRNTSTGQNVVWLMNGTTYSSYVELYQVADTNWEIVGTGDFSGDGKTDILWRNKSSGQNVIWLMNGTTYSNYVELLQVPGTNWKIVGTGDFNGDGKTDILWRNKSTGQDVVWLMNGTTYSSYAELMQVTDTNWEIVSTGDFNGDGKTDILWRNKSTGQNVVWLMNGTTYGSYTWLIDVPDTNWEIVAPK